jgi:aspartokinase
MLIVKKFGGSSVANKDRIFNVAKRCIEDYKAGHDVVVVLSAMGDTTDELIALANTINPDAKKRELDMLLTTGEQVSVSLMAMAMQALDVPAVSLNAFQVMMQDLDMMREMGANAVRTCHSVTGMPDLKE